MRRSASCKSRFTLVFVTVLLAVMMLSSAHADDGLEITIWYGHNGESVLAVSLSPTGTDYWAQLPPDAFDSEIGITLNDLYGRYAGWNADFGTIDGNQMTISGVSSAGSSVDGFPTLTIYALDAYGTQVAVYSLYLSVSPVPQEQPVGPTSADIQVYYRTEDGMPLGGTTVTIATNNGDTIYAQEFGGYQLVSEGSVYVTVDGNGNPSQNPVTFTYRALPQSADIQVYYQTEDGTSLGGTTVTIASNNGDTIYAQEFGGYQLVSEGNVYVTVDGNGNPSQNPVTFTYRALPQSAEIQVYYQTEDGTSLGGTTVTIASSNGDTIYAQEFSGYQLVSEGSVYVTVDGNGNPSQNPVTFTYRVLPLLPQSADITVYYQTEDGTSLGGTTVTIASNNGDTIYAQEFSGYQLVSEGSVYVTVDGNGNPSQNPVTFTYRALPQSADITVNYQTEDGTSLGGTTVTIASNSGDTIYAQEFSGYQLMSEGSVYVTVDGNGNPSQNPVTFTYRALPQSADITVNYQTEDGTSLGGTTVTIASNSGDTIYAQEFSGYQLVSEGSVYVTVDGNGNPSQNPVTFTYRALPQSADITVNYQTEDGTSLGGTTVTIASNDGDTIYAQEFGGYQLVSEGSVYVTVDGNGNPSQNPVTFTYRALPQSADITVNYQTEDGTPLGGTTVTIASNNGDTIYAQEFGGYQLVSEGSVYVTVDGNGNPSQNPVTFTYRALPQNADIKVNYQTEDGTSLGGTTVTIASNNGDTIYAQEFSGYQLVSEGSVYVTVDGNGNPSQNPVTFTYRALPQSADITVNYQTEDGTSLGGTTVTIASNNGDTIYAQEFSGYQLVSEGSVYVTVDGNGNPSQNPVTFTYRALPKNAEITVYYQTEDGTSLGGTTVTIASNSGDTIYAQELSGYQLVSESSVYVTVDGNGNPSQNPVTFTYRALPKNAEITVNYQTEDGTSLGGTTVTIASNSGDTIYAQELSGYQLVSEGSVYVTVDGNGNPSQNPVTFTYRALPDSVEIQVLYTLVDETEISRTTLAVARGESRTIAAEVPDGYRLVAGTEGQFTVTVDAVGNPDRDKVIFLIERIPQDGTVAVFHKTQDGSILEQENLTVPAEGSLTVNAKNYDGYALEDGQPTEISVSCDRDGKVNPAEVTFVYRALPGSAEILILYTLVDGTEINRTTVAIARGESKTIAAEVPNGYQLVAGTEGQFTVTVDALGNPDADKVIFVIESIPQDGTVTVYHKGQDGNVLEQETLAVTSEGQLTVRAKNYDGYTLEEGQPAEITVTCDRDGNVNPPEVTFVYRVLPGSVSIPVIYVTADGMELSRSEVQIARGDSRRFDAEPPTGYRLTETSPQSVTVTINDLGVADTNEVRFIVERIPQNGTVTVYYCDLGGNYLSSQTVQVTGGQTVRIAPDPAAVPAGYDPSSAAAQTVQVANNGTANPNQIYFNLARLDDPAETPVPNKAGTLVERWAKTKENNVKLRRGSGRNTTELANIRSRDSDVWVIDMVQGMDGWVWDHVIYNGQEGYIRSDKLTILKQASSDNAQQSVATPVPTVTPTPTPPVITPTPTPTPEVVTPTPTPGSYHGFALSGVTQSLLSATSTSARGLQTINQGDLLTVGGQVTNQGTVWSYVITENGASGYVPDNTLQRISDEEAAAIRQRNITPAPATPTPTPVPMHVGYFKPVGDNVPLRAQPNEVSVLLRLLNRETNGIKTVVYVSGQIYDTEDGWIWHVVRYDGVEGFIRSDMLVELSNSEREDYLNGNTPVPVTPVVTPSGIDYSTMSSYGYIKSANDRSVNIRNSPNGSKLTELQPYATCLVLGTQTLNGTTWYNIKFDNGTKNVDGWVKGDSANEAGFFHQMTMEEFQQFVQSPQYLEGIRRNSTSNATAKPDATSGIASIEEQNVQEWTDPNSGSNVNYATWAPIPTTKPIDYVTPTPTPANQTFNPTQTDPNGLPGTSYLPISTQPGSDIADVEPANALPTATGTAEGQHAGVTDNTDNPPDIPWGLIIGGSLAVIGGGVGVGIYLHTQNKRNAAKRAAQRRAQAGSSAARQNPQPATYNNPRTGAQPGSGTAPTGMNGSVGGNGRPVNPSASNPYQPKFSSTTAQTPQNGSIYNAPVHGATAQQASTSAYQRPANMTSPLSAPTGTAPAPELPKAAPAAPETAPTAGTTAAAQPTASPYRANDPAAPADTAQPAQTNPEATPRNRRAGQTGNNDDLYKPMT